MKKKKPKQLYFKLFWTYTAIVIVIVTALVLYFLSASRRRALEGNQQAAVRIVREAASYIEETKGIADYVFEDLYRSSSELEDLLAYFEMGPEEYQRYCLDRYADSGSLVYRGIHNFINEAFEAYENMQKIELISYRDFRLTSCYPEKIFYQGKDGKDRLYRTQQEGYAERGKLIYAKEIRDPDTMESKGRIVFTFDGKENFQKALGTDAHTMLTVVSGTDKRIYQKPGDEDWEELLYDKRYFVFQEATDSYQVYGLLNISQASRLPIATFLTILGVGTLAVALGILCIGFYVRRLTSRVDAILYAMNQVTKGNLHQRIELKKGRDELDMVAGHFNEMCGKLELYIQKSYLAEIERKNAQLQALQSQINPHFLYNTLEAIRMKAICNGDREVGKMLYSMVTLFRSQLKEADVITLGQELDYCKQYMGLFEYRYQGCFSSRVECPVELLSLPVIKFVLQPVVENYFIHGIRRERQDNLLTIRAEREGERLYLRIQDNGRGMTPEEIREKNTELSENRQDGDGRKSIGIANVNRRIKAVYGEEYGIFIQAAKPEGLLVTVAIKIEEEEKNEEGHAGRG